MAVVVVVHAGNCDLAMKLLKKKMQRELVFYSMKKKRSYEKPSAIRKREKQESARKIRKLRRSNNNN